MNNRQLRSWVFMLYPDNPKHLKAIDYIDLLDNSLYIKHIAKYDEEGNEINKEHYHCILKYEQGYWLNKLLNDLDLGEEDTHLFHSFRDFKKGNRIRFKTLDDYVLYLDHMDDPSKEDKYDPDDFHGGLKSWALKIILSRDKGSFEKLLDLSMFIRQYNLDNFMDTRQFTFTDWFNVCCQNGFGDIFYSNWYRMRDILKPYLNY